jgi:hypothetical protein
MLQNVTHVLTMHPFPRPPNKLIIIVIKSMQMQVKFFLIITSYYFVFWGATRMMLYLNPYSNGRTYLGGKTIAYIAKQTYTTTKLGWNSLI